jgi:hypothetical protein
VFGTAAAVALAVILVVAFTGGRRDEPLSPRPTTTPASADRQLFGGSLQPDVRYRDPAFIPAVSFVVADTEWYAIDTSATTSLLLERRNRVPGQPDSERRPAQFLGFNRLTEVYDPERRGLTGSLVPAPADLVGWLSSHPDLEAGVPEQVTVAGVPGEAVSIVVRFRRPAHADPACRQAFRRACTAIAPGATFFDGTRMRAIVLRTEPDPLVITLIVAPRGDLDELEAAAAPVLRSLRIGVE